MVVMLIKPKDNIQYDITEACPSYSWSGSASEAVRSFSFEYLNAPYDNTLRLPQVVRGRSFTGRSMALKRAARSERLPTQPWMR